MNGTCGTDEWTGPSALGGENTVDLGRRYACPRLVWQRALGPQDPGGTVDLGRLYARPWLVWRLARVLGSLALYASLVGMSQAQEPTREVLVLDAERGGTAIVLAEQATSSAQYAALELQVHLEKITGAKVPIAREPAVPDVPVKLAIGATRLGATLGFPVTTLEPWEFLVAERAGTIVLAGGDDPKTDPAEWNSLHLVFAGKPNGTCRAIYEFLEQYCGVHWYLPSDAGMVTPQTRRLTVRIGAPSRRRTAFRSTSFYPYQVNANMFCPPDTPELTGATVPDSDSEKWRRNLWTIPVTTTDMLPVIEVQRWLLRNKVGGEPYGPNHSFGNWLSRFGRQHPEWFSYKDKARIEAVLAGSDADAFNEFHTSGEPCLTAPGVFEQVLADARDFMDREQGHGDPARKDVLYQGSQGRFFGIVPNDNYAWCQCDTCRPLYGKPSVDCPLWGSASGRASSYLWDFANRVARDLRSTHPEAWVGGIGYHDYMPPPRDFKLEPNVAVTLCTYLGNWTPELRQTAYGLVRAWRDQAQCQWLGMWEYYCYCSMSQYQPMFPKVCPRLLGEDVKELHRLGVVAEFLESEDYYRFKDAPERGWAVWTNPICLYLNVWIRFKLWDDTRQDVGHLLAEHYRLFYGPAAAPVQTFFERIEARVTDSSLRGPKTFSDLSNARQLADFEYLFPPAIMAELRRAVDTATAAAPTEPYKTRVGWIRMGFLEPQEKALARHLEQRQRGAAHRPRETVAYHLQTPPVVDGVAGDTAWAGLPLNVLNDWRSGAPPPAATSFRLGWDDTALYLLVRCDDPTVKTLRAACLERDGEVYQDDCVELHLSVDSERTRRFQILVNSRGVIQDLAYSLNEGGTDVANRDWTCSGATAAATVDDRGYTVELKVPLAAVGGGASPGTLLYANVCRERYSDATAGQPAELQSWSVTQGGFNEGRYFGRVLLATADGWQRFLNAETPLPDTVLFKVDAANPWVVAPTAIRAVAERDQVRFAMDCPPVAEVGGRTYGGFQVTLDPPVDAALFPCLEVAFRKSNPEIMLELIYAYVGEDGKDATNYFVFSPYGEISASQSLFAGGFAAGSEKGKSAPRQIKGLTLYGVVEGAKTPLACDFAVQWLRVCRETLREPQP